MSILICLFIILTILLNALASNNIDPDFWARLLQGNAFLTTGEILKTDPYSYTQTHQWIDHEWGSGVIFSFVLNHFGFNGIICLRVFIGFLIFLFIYKAMEKIDKRSFVLYFFITLYAMPTIYFSGLRCHFFTFLFFTIFLYILELVRKRENYKLLCILPFLMIIWGNCHGGCVAGLGLLGIYTVGEAFNKKPYKFYLFTLLASICVLLINPYGFDYIKFILMASTMKRPFVTEWTSPFMNTDLSFMLWFKLVYIFNLILFLRSYKSLKQDITKALILLICAVLSFIYVKNTPFFIITSMIFLYKPLKDNLTHLCSIFILIFTSITTMQVKNYFFLSEQPYKEVEFLKINNLSGKIIAPFDMGSYIAYKLYPNNLIYMDGRYEEVYCNETKELLDKFFNVQDGWEKILEEPYKPDYIIIPDDAEINNYIPKNYKVIARTYQNIIYASDTKLKTNYVKPENNMQYYINSAFDKYL